jgi:hypothetical protein
MRRFLAGNAVDITDPGSHTRAYLQLICSNCQALRGGFRACTARASGDSGESLRANFNPFAFDLRFAGLARITSGPGVDAMLLRYLARSASRSQTMREQCRRSGRTMNGRFPIWTDEEDAEIRRLYPDYAALKKSLTRRTHSALKSRANRIGIAKRNHCWTDAEVSRLRKLFPTSTAQQLRTAFPGLRTRQIKDKAANLGLYKKRRPYPPSGFPIIDQIRARAFELNLSMLDLDELAGTKNYFEDRRWRRCRINGWAVCLAVDALAGDVRAIWRDE